MKVIEKGHVYDLEDIDGCTSRNRITFVNREKGTEHPGTQVQDVLRVLIDRVQHCDACLPWAGNAEILQHLRMALVLHEARALAWKTEKGTLAPEKVAVNRVDGHFELDR